ncbi:MAG: hypothetical protein AAF985_07950 [Bacteroidota bacterium]
MNFSKLCTCLLFVAALLSSCGNDPCKDIACPAGFEKIEVGDECQCQETGSSNPCANVSCPTGFSPIVDGSGCDCIENPDNFDLVAVTGLLNGTVSWTRDKIYVLNGKVVVDEGATLNIEAGTVIKAAAGNGSLASALIVARGGKLMAEGTADNPIIFTSVDDNLMPGQKVSPNLDESFNSLWGGLIILGRAPISAQGSDTEAQIEGIPADDLFGRYGGDDPADNSGVIKYISVRHGGTLIGDNNEINGITFGGVGNGTLVENIEVVANLDDGVEFFGGTVNVTNVVVANGEDDGLDIDQNYSGTITNAFVIQSGATAGDNALEIDGPEGSTYTDGLFTIRNVTIIDEDGLSDNAADLKSRAQGTIDGASWRGFTDYVLIRASFKNECAQEGEDSYLNYTNNSLKIINSEWVGNGTFNDWTDVYVDDDDMDGAGNVCPEPAEYDSNVTNKLQDAANGNQVHGSPAKGADPAPFQGWSWTALNGKI